MEHGFDAGWYKFEKKKKKKKKNNRFLEKEYYKI